MRRPGRPDQLAAFQLYDDVAQATAGLVVSSYSTSFGLACRLLAEPVRTHVRNIYALVRVADEIVDAPRPGSSPEQREAVLDALRAELDDAVASGHSSNLVVHAYARTARACGIGADLVDPFFAAMRADLSVRRHDPSSFDRYVHGSAEVVGLMCLRAFLVDQPSSPRRPAPATYDELAPAASRLGAAFQKVNFLRDLAADGEDLGRTYFPGVDPARLTDAERDAILDDIDADLDVAARAIPRLPDGSRRAVALAHGLFAELAQRLRRTPAARIRQERIRVPNLVKARIAAVTVLGSLR